MPVRPSPPDRGCWAEGYPGGRRILVVGNDSGGWTSSVSGTCALRVLASSAGCVLSLWSFYLTFSCPFRFTVVGHPEVRAAPFPKTAARSPRLTAEQNLSAVSRIHPRETDDRKHANHEPPHEGCHGWVRNYLEMHYRQGVPGGMVHPCSAGQLGNVRRVVGHSSIRLGWSCRSFIGGMGVRRAGLLCAPGATRHPPAPTAGEGADAGSGGFGAEDSTARGQPHRYPAPPHGHGGVPPSRTGLPA